MRKLFSLLLLITFLFSCSSKSKYIKKEEILNSLFDQFDSVESISYEDRFVFAETTDTATTYAYYEEAHDSTGYLLNYNCITYRFNKLFYQDVFNTNENTNYYLNENATITDYDNPPKMFGGISSISWSLLTQVKFLKQTANDYPERIKIIDTTINNNEYYKIAFTNPDGLPLKDRPMYLFTDTIYPTSLIVNVKNANIEFITWGKMFHHISKIHFNPNQPDSIWSITNLPEYFRSKVGVPVDIEAKFVIPKGKIIPNWNFKTIENKDYRIINDSSFSIYVFFTRKCGACIKEIPILNTLNKNDKLKVIGIYFEENINDLKDFINKHKIEYEVILNNDNELKEKFKEGAFPVNYLIDKNGMILYSVLGNRPNFEEKVLEIINN